VRAVQNVELKVKVLEFGHGFDPVKKKKSIERKTSFTQKRK